MLTVIIERNFNAVRGGLGVHLGEPVEDIGPISKPDARNDANDIGAAGLGVPGRVYQRLADAMLLADLLKFLVEDLESRLEMLLRVDERKGLLPAMPEIEHCFQAVIGDHFKNFDNRFSASIAPP